MSTAEITARRIYDSYRFHDLPDEVRRHVAILCLIPTEDKENVDADEALTLSVNEKRIRATEAFLDAQNGNWSSTEELCDNLDSKYPWLCK